MAELDRRSYLAAHAIEIEKPSLSAANSAAQRILALPQVSRATTLSNFITQDQDQKLKLIRNTAAKIDPSLDPERVEPSPTDQEIIRILSSAEDSLSTSAGSDRGPGADAARRLCQRTLLSACAAPGPARAG